MPSSTSSSERHVPAGNWGRTFWLAALIAVLATAGWEMYWRSQGYVPTLNDTANLWAANRTELANSSPERTVVIGSSRVLFDFQLDDYAEYFGTERPIQLSLPGGCPLPVLEHLAADEKFRGTLLCGVVPGLYFVPEGFPVDRAKDAIEHYENWSPSGRMGNFLGIQLEKRLAFKQQEDLPLNALLERLEIPNRPGAQIPPRLPPYFYRMDEHRQADMWEVLEFDSPLAHKIQNIWVPLFTPPPPPPEVTPEQAREMYGENMENYLSSTRECVDIIRGRGGRVVFLRYPSSDRMREMENEFSPRPGFWDQIIARSGAPGIHFEDYPELSKFKCPEWSHLTKADAEEFSRRLMPILEQVLEESGG